MPRAFATEEKIHIRSLLMKAGLARFGREGVRAARIDDLCRDAGIAKGSFYAFFPSKEELFMTIADEREAGHRADMLAHVESFAGTQRACAYGFFDMLVAKIETDPVLSMIMRHEEIPYLMRKLGPDRMRQGEASDAAFVAEVAARWPRQPVSSTDLLALMTMTLSLVISARSMTPGQYRPALALLRDLFADRLVGGRND